MAKRKMIMRTNKKRKMMMRTNRKKKMVNVS